MILKPELCLLVLSYSFSHFNGDSVSMKIFFEFLGCVVQVYSVVLEEQSDSRSNGC